MRRARFAFAAFAFAIATLIVLAGCGGSKPSEDVKLGGIALTEVLDGLMNRTNQALRGISDGPSADAAKKSLAAIDEDFDDLAFHLPKLSPDGRTEFAKHVEKRLPEMEQMRAMVHRSPQLSMLLGDEMDRIATKMAGLLSPTAGEDLQ